MNEHSLSKRLAMVGAEVPSGARLADIGSDHAYLPTALMLEGKIQYAVAGEVVKGPFESAKRQVAKNGLSNKITVRLADGLAAVVPEDRIDTVTIAGMGGTLIAHILDEGVRSGNLQKTERLILQPNVGEQNVRQWLIANEYWIEREHILEENDKIYEIIVALPVTAAKTDSRKGEYTEKELFFGPLLAVEKSPIFLKKWQKEQQNRQRVWNQLQQAGTPQTEKITEIKEQLSWIEEILAD